MSDERWLPIPGWEGYEVSDMGRVRSLDRVVRCRNGNQRRCRGQVLKARPDKLGYPYVRLVIRPRSRLYGSHQLVLLAFVGPRPDGQVARHLNGDSSDPRLVNLAYGTQTENNLDAVAHGTHWLSRRTHCRRGHELSGDNVKLGRTASGTRRFCRACWRINSRRYKQRKTGAVLRPAIQEVS